MPKPEDRFELRITVEPVKISPNGERKSYGHTEQVYNDMNYGDMVMAQRVALTALVESLTGIGLEIAASMHEATKAPKK